MTFMPLHFRQLENQCRDLYISDLLCKNKTIFAISEKIKSPFMTFMTFMTFMNTNCKRKILREFSQAKTL